MHFDKFVDIDRLTYSALPSDNGVGEGSWAGLCFSPNQISMVSFFSTIIGCSMHLLFMLKRSKIFSGHAELSYY